MWQIGAILTTCYGLHYMVQDTRVCSRLFSIAMCRAFRGLSLASHDIVEAAVEPCQQWGTPTKGGRGRQHSTEMEMELKTDDDVSDCCGCGKWGLQLAQLWLIQTFFRSAFEFKITKFDSVTGNGVDCLHDFLKQNGTPFCFNVKT